MPWPPLLREVAKKRLGHVIFLEHHIGQKGTPFPPDNIEADWDAIVPVKPLAHLAQCISKLLPFETNLDLVHCWPALPETPPPFPIHKRQSVSDRSQPPREGYLQLSLRPLTETSAFPFASHSRHHSLRSKSSMGV